MFAKVSLPSPARPVRPVQQVLIERCSDPSYWYAKRVGQVMAVEWEDAYGYWAREGGIYNAINFIKPADARVLSGGEN